MSVSDTGGRPSPSNPASTLGPGAHPAASVARSPADTRSRAPVRTRGRWVLLALVLVALAVIGWVILHARSQKAAGGGAGGPPGGRGGRGGGAGAVTSVNAAKVGLGDVPIYLNELGTATPPATVTVLPQIAGQLFSVAFREGQMVAKGQLLAQIDPRPYEATLAQAQGSLARDEALLTNARLDLVRYQTLVAQDSLARQTLDTQAALVRQDEGTVAQDKGAVLSARVNLGYTRITAPVSGRLGLRQVDPGNYVTSGSTNGLVTIAQITPIDVVFTLPEDSIPQVMKRLQGGARLVATAFDRAQTAAIDDGYLLTLDNQIDTTTGTVKAKARFDNADGGLFPNQFVNLRLLVDTLHGAVIAPSSAILRGQNGLYVWVVDNDRAVHVRPVKTGPASGENTAVLSGLQPGETVVTDGSDRLREGGSVTLPGDCPPPPPPGAHGARHGHAGGSRAPGGDSAGASGAGRCVATAVSTGQAGGGAARMQAMIAQLGLDPAQQAKVNTILAATQAQAAKARDSGDFQAMRQLRQQSQTQIEAVLRPDQKSKFEALRAQGGGGGRGGYGAGHASFGGAETQEPASRGGGAPIGDLPQRSAGPPASGPHGSLSGPAPAATAPEASGQYSDSGSGRGGGGAQALLGHLNLDASQQAQAQAIFAASREKGRADYEAGDMDGARAARMDAMKRLEAILRPDQKAKLAAARAQMRGQGGDHGGRSDGGAGGGL